VSDSPLPTNRKKFTIILNILHMPKNRPTIGQTNWGTPLNDHLNQLMPNGGGINFSGSAPTGLTATDDGYTYVNTTTREILRWNGTGWDVLLGGVAVGRETLSANRTYYVNSNGGNDSNNGLTAGTAFATFPFAVDFVRNRLDTQDFTVTIQLADSATAYAGISRFGIDTKLIIKGNSSTPANVVIDGGLEPFAHSCIRIGQATKEISVDGVKCINTSSVLIPGLSYYELIAAQSGTNMKVKNCEFGTSALSSVTHQLVSYGGASMNIEGGIVISGSARAHLYSGSNLAITGTTTPAIVIGTVTMAAFVLVYDHGSLQVFPSVPATYISSGAVTGSRYNVGVLSSIITNGKGINYFPGSTAGGVDGTSTYGL
jgi:hypothetical protein